MIRFCTPVLRLVAVILLMLAAGASNFAQTVTWTGGGDGVSWNRAANWSSNLSLPGAADDMVIPAGAQAISFNVAHRPMYPTIKNREHCREAIGLAAMHDG